MAIQLLTAVSSTRIVRWYLSTHDPEGVIVSGFVGGCGLVFIPFTGALSVIIADKIINHWRYDSLCQCGYDLTGNVSGVCPECGTRIEHSDE